MTAATSCRALCYAKEFSSCRLFLFSRRSNRPLLRHATNESYGQKKPRNLLNFREMGYALLVIPISAFGLGVWQVKRRTWKLNLIKELETQTMAEPVPFPSDTDELTNMEYRRVVVEGEFDHSREMYIGLRSAVADDDKPQKVVGGARPNIGVNVITPFKLADKDLTILVNRGWVPRSRNNPQTRLEGQITGPVKLTGIVRKTEKRQPFQDKTLESSGLFMRRDVEVMADAAGTAPIFLDADRKSTVPGGPIGGQTRVTLRNEHFSYILTWFSLSTITSWMWYRMYWLR